MVRPVSFGAVRTAKRSESTFADRPFVFWALVVGLVLAACTVLLLDASITPAQRIALLEQSGLFP